MLKLRFFQLASKSRPARSTSHSLPCSEFGSLALPWDRASGFLPSTLPLPVKHTVYSIQYAVYSIKKLPNSTQAVRGDIAA